MKRKNYIIITIYVVAGISLILGGIVSSKIYEYENKPKYENKSKSENSKGTKKEKEDEKDQYISPVPSLIESYNNSDIIAQLSIPSLEFSYPVVQTSDNDYYLHHNFNNEESTYGAIFSDFRTEDLNVAKQINIYSHNDYYNVLPFKTLENYQNLDFFNTHTDIYLNTNKKSLHYKVLAVKIITTEDEHMVISFGDNDAFLNHIRILRENALYDTGDEINIEDRLLILQTCLWNPGNRKILVMAKIQETI